MRGMGIDVVDVSRMETILARTPALAAEVFTEGERAACEAEPKPARAYAAWFAAKESFLKALGLGIWDGVVLKDVEVQKTPGEPRFVLGPSAREALARVGGTAARLSFSYVRGLAMAVVVVP